MREIVHMIGYEEGAKLPMSGQLRTRCGRTIMNPILDESEAAVYTLISQNGNIFHCTTSNQAVSCLKCLNTIRGAQSEQSAE